jgi:hypothetical protein
MVVATHPDVRCAAGAGETPAATVSELRHTRERATVVMSDT